MKNRTFSHLCSLSLLLVTTTSLTAQTSKPDPSLTPPGAPANKVFKTLDQVEPRIPINNDTTPGDSDSLFRIVNPGSYYLTANLQGVALKSGIKIDADEVTLDFSGFTLTGATNSKGAISVNSSSRTHITNGQIKGWRTEGIRTEGPGNQKCPCHISNIKVQDNAGSGINVNEGCVEGCTAVGNLNIGIFVSGPWVIRDCLAFANGGNGFQLYACVIERCNARENQRSGFVVAFPNASRCISSSNFEHGFNIQYNPTIPNCVADYNGTNGASGAIPDAVGFYLSFQTIVFANYCRLDNNHCTGNDIGIRVESTSNIVIRNSALGNTVKVYDIKAGNIVGPIVKSTTTADITESSVSMPGVLSSTNPFANFAD